MAQRTIIFHIEIKNKIILTDTICAK